MTYRRLQPELPKEPEESLGPVWDRLDELLGVPEKKEKEIARLQKLERMRQDAVDDGYFKTFYVFVLPFFLTLYWSAALPHAVLAIAYLCGGVWMYRKAFRNHGADRPSRSAAFMYTGGYAALFLLCVSIMTLRLHQFGNWFQMPA